MYSTTTSRKNEKKNVLSSLLVDNFFPCPVRWKQTVYF